MLLLAQLRPARRSAASAFHLARLALAIGSITASASAQTSKLVRHSDRIQIPETGESTIAMANEVSPAVLNPDAVRAFITHYQATKDDSALVPAQRALNSNALMPTELLDSFMSLLEKSDTYPKDGFTEWHLLPFKRRTGPGYMGGRFGITKSGGIITSASVPGSNGPLWLETKRSLPEALGHFRNYLAARGADLATLRVSAMYYGKRIIILTAKSTDIIIHPDPPPTRFFMYADLNLADISPVDDRTIEWIIDHEFAPLTQEKRPAAIKTYLTLRYGYDGLINSVRDIPGVRKHPPDPDVAAAIRAPFEFVDRTISHEPRTVVVLYTYSQLGGVVTRYRFNFQEGALAGVDIAVLGQRVGEWQVLM